MKNKTALIIASTAFSILAVCAYFKFTPAPAFTFDYSENENGITINEYKGFRPKVQVPEKIKGLPVTEIGKDAFEGCKSREILLPESVTKIEYGAFQRSSVRSFVFPENVTEISDIIFSDCNNLESVILPDHAEKIGMSAFSYCPNLKSIEIPDTVTEIEDWAFMCDKQL